MVYAILLLCFTLLCLVFDSLQEIISSTTMEFYEFVHLGVTALSRRSTMLINVIQTGKYYLKKMIEKSLEQD